MPPGQASPTPPPPAVPQVQEPPAGLTRARWLYVDEAMTHEVHAGLRRTTDGGEWVVRESAYNNDDPDEIVQTTTRVDEGWEAQMLHMELETRLALLGRYWRFDTQKPGWTRLRSAAATESVDLRPVDVQLFPGDAVFHHFRSTTDRRCAVIVQLPHLFPHGMRYLVATADMTFPDAEAGTLALAHQRLPLAPARSLVTREHRLWHSKRYQKLVQPEDFQRAYGADWRRELLTCYRGILERLARGAYGAGTVRVGPAPIEDPLYTDYMRMLSDPRVAALHAQYLTADEETALMAGGEEFIKQAIARKRAKAPREEQHLLSILEASLLARDGLRHGVHKVDPEVAALVRRFAYYL